MSDINVTGEHRLRQAFLRRSLAYDLAGVGAFAVLDRWTQKLFEKMNEAPLANCRQMSVDQVINADKALRVKVSDATRGRLHTTVGTDKLFDVEFGKYCDHTEILQRLMPLQAHGHPHSDSQPDAANAKGQFGGKGGKGKDKGKGKGPGITAPDDCEIFVGNKHFRKKWQVGRCSAKIKAGKRCMIG